MKKVVKKAKSGGSFPDLNKDGKITKADVLVGRGVIKAKKGKTVKKAQLGGLVDKLVGGLGKKSGGFSGIKDMFGNSGFAGAGLGLLNALRKKKQASAQAATQAPAPAMKKGGKALKKQAAVAIAMKAAGKKPKTMKAGGSLKPVDKSKNPGLSKLPTAVRNKMGFQKMGGATKKCRYGCK